MSAVVEMGDAGVRLRFHRNEAPLAPPAHVVRAVQTLESESLRTYPIEAQRALFAELAAKLEVAETCLAIGNGADEILAAVCRANLGAGDNALTVSPTFGMYARCIALARADTRAIPYARRFELDATALVDATDDRTRLVLLGNPNNPTCDSIDEDVLAYLASSVPDAAIAIDEVYLALSERSLLRRARTLENVVIIGSLSKTAGLAGMRIGYAIASPERAARIRQEITPFPLGAASIAAARAYLTNDAETLVYEALLAAQVKRSLDAIVATLRPFARNVWRGACNFVLVEFGPDAREIAGRLKARGIAIRCLPDANLSDMVRVSSGNDRDTDELLAEMIRVIREVRS